MPAGRYGWKRQELDFRDWKYRVPAHVVSALPPIVNLFDRLPAVLDQGKLGSCGPNAASTMIGFSQRTQSLPVFAASRLFTYYNTRVLMGPEYTGQDSGVDNRSMLKALAQYGFCDEALWPYAIDRFTQRPPDLCYAASAINRITSYAVVEQSEQQMKGCVAAGHPFLFGFTVAESFESDEVARTGTVPMPGVGERKVGGHDVVIYGYDDTRRVWLFRNSWDGWGNNGNGTLPYAYGLDQALSGDFWVINAVPVTTPLPPPPSPPSGGLFSLTFNRPVRKGGRIVFDSPVAVPAGVYNVVPEHKQADADVSATGSA